MAKYNINYAKSFIKDYKKLQTKEKDLTDALIDKLANGKTLDKAQRPRAKWQSARH